MCASLRIRWRRANAEHAGQCGNRLKKRALRRDTHAKTVAGSAFNACAEACEGFADCLHILASVNANNGEDATMRTASRQFKNGLNANGWFEPACVWRGLSLRLLGQRRLLHGAEVRCEDVAFW